MSVNRKSGKLSLACVFFLAAGLACPRASSARSLPSSLRRADHQGLEVPGHARPPTSPADAARAADDARFVNSLRNQLTRSP